VCYKISVKNEKLTTKEAQKLLESRGIKVVYSTIAHWVRSGKFVDAVQEDTPRGAVWYIPRSSVENFQPPAPGRPPKAEKVAVKN
jgi:hypothetical protein